MRSAFRKPQCAASSCSCSPWPLPTASPSPSIGPWVWPVSCELTIRRPTSRKKHHENHLHRRLRPRRSHAETHGAELCAAKARSEEHTSELQSPCNLVCRLLLEKKKHSRSQHRAIR